MKKPEKAKYELLTRNAVFFSMVLFALVLAIGGAAFFLSTRQTMRTGKNETLTLLMKNEQAKLNDYMSAGVDAALKMANSRTVQRHFEEPDNKVLTRLASEEIAKIRKDIKGDVIFWVNNVDRKLYHGNGRIAGVVDPSDPQNYWYGMTLFAPERYFYDINYNQYLNVTNLWINVPVLDGQRKPVGMIAIGSGLAAFIDGVYQNYKEENTHLFFFNDAGEFTCASDVKLVSSKKKLESQYGYVGVEILAAAKKLSLDETQIFKTSIGEIGISKATPFGWYTLVISPNRQSAYKVNMMWIFIVVIITLGIILAVFNIYVSRLFKPLENTMKALEAALKVKDDFLAKMSHEIRTPMNAITGMAELALREGMTNSAIEHVYTIKQAGTNLLSIINDILDLSKIESEKLEIIPVEYHFAALVNDVVSIIRMRVVDSEVKFVVNVDSRIPSVLVGDEVRVRQILLNMLSNAVKYTENGHISLAISGKLTDDDNSVILNIDVVDTGKGIKPEEIGKLFGKFVQLDTASNRGIEGTGLGLVITKSLVTAMGGQISVMSEYGKGSTFTVTLPQKIHSHDSLAAVDKPEEKCVIIFERRDIYANSMACTIDNLGVNCASVSRFEELRRKLVVRDYPFIFVESALYEDAKIVLSEFKSKAKIVLLTSFGHAVTDKGLSVVAMPVHSTTVANILNGISDTFSYHADESFVVKFSAPEARVLAVDDIKTNLEVTRGLMSPYDMKVDVCLSGAEAIRAVKANDYDLIFMDHMMPEMDGIEAVRRIRKLGTAYGKIPIIALTANAVSGAREMFLQNDFNGFLSKPVDIAQLGAILEKWIPKKKQKPASKKIKGDTEVRTDIFIEGVNVKSGIARMGGTAAAYLRTLSIFLSDGREKIGELRKWQEAGDLHRFTVSVHALKGAAGNIGAAELSKAAKELEDAGHREDRQFIQKHTPRLLADLETLLREVEKAVCRTGGGAVSEEAVKAALNAMNAAIGNLDPDAINTASAELRRLSAGCPPSVASAIEKILRNTLIGEYDEVVSAIELFIGDKINHETH